MRTNTRPWTGAVVMVLALLAAACGGGEAEQAADDATSAAGEAASEAGSEAAEGASEMARASEAGAEIDTTCQIDLPADGEGSAQGMADDPVATAASNNPALSALVQAVTQANLVDTLNDTATEYTVFAPVNDAFAAIPEADLQAVLADNEQLTSILTLHVVPSEQLDAAALAEAGTVTTVNGEQLTVSVADGALTVNDQASVICPNVMTGNATVHLIDAVLMPQG